MQVKQDFMLEIQDERPAGLGTLESRRTVHRFASAQGLNRLPVVLTQPTEKAIVRAILLDGVRQVRKPLDDVPCPVRHDALAGSEEVVSLLKHRYMRILASGRSRSLWHSLRYPQAPRLVPDRGRAFRRRSNKLDPSATDVRRRTTLWSSINLRPR